MTTIQEFQANGLVLKRNEHTAKELVDFVKQESTKRGASLSDVQQRALARLPLVSYADMPKLAYLEAMLTIFDDLFFGSTLAAVTTIKYKERTSPFGILGSQRQPLAKYDILITLWTHRSDSELDFAGTLLHEHVHGFIACFLAVRFHELFWLSARVVGKTGHGGLFQDIAWATEKALLELTGKKLDTHLERSFPDELAWWPKGPAIEIDVKSRWGFAPTVFDKAGTLRLRHVPGKIAKNLVIAVKNLRKTKERPSSKNVARGEQDQ